MKQFILLVVLVVLGLGAYCYFFDPAALEKYVPAVAELVKRSPKGTVAAGLVAVETVGQANAASPAAATTSAPASAPVSIAQPVAAAAPAAPATQVVAASSSLPPSSAQAAPAAPAPEAPAFDTIKLKNGKTITGKVFITDPDITWIRTEDGKTQEVKTRDILSGLPARR